MLQGCDLNSRIPELRFLACKPASDRGYREHVERRYQDGLRLTVDGLGRSLQRLSTFSRYSRSEAAFQARKRRVPPVSPKILFCSAAHVMGAHVRRAAPCTGGSAATPSTAPHAQQAQHGRANPETAPRPRLRSWSPATPPLVLARLPPAPGAAITATRSLTLSQA